MKPKQLTTILAIIFLIGIVIGGVNADEYIGVINNITGIDISDFTAGTTTTANFSFDYEDSYDADKHYPLIFKINISYAGNGCSLPSGDCSVWENDFEINGVLRRYYFFGLYHKDIGLNCSKESPLTINHQMGSNTINNIPNDTFYCYNITEGTIKDLKKHSKVFLNIFSNPALYPATYKITAQMFYVNDTYAPIVNITNKNMFDLYYGKNDKVSVEINVIDGSPINQVYGIADLISENLEFNDYHFDNDIYYFQETTSGDILEGNYNLTFFAEDESGNIGNDTTILKIDTTGPNITAIQPNGSIYEEIIPVELNVTDKKAGVNNQSVYYRLREMNGTSICPEDGIGTWDCYNSDWVKLDFNLTTQTYKTEINTTEVGLESGEYWFEAKAEDILGNEGVLE